MARLPVADAQKMALVPLDLQLEAVADRLTPTLRAHIQREFGAYLGKPAHPVSVGNRLNDLLCTTCLADRPLGEARRLFGHAFLRRAHESLVGRVMVAAMPLLGLERVLRQAPQDFGTLTNYGTRWVTQLDRHHWRCDFEDELFYPDFLSGVFESTYALMRAREPQLSYTMLGPRHISFEIRWK
jgi:uncharacterized protein (TIGR02265 family)